MTRKTKQNIKFQICITTLTTLLSACLVVKKNSSDDSNRPLNASFFMLVCICGEESLCEVITCENLY